ncbi:MAG: hypothetical protein KKA07_18400 [Bacteroidetes bacterium]|nr:hypothetical protein [Bacteroidota bacterium]MBU1721043.1 hypothetical protein [Bacteroidota bacterium]
MDSVKNYYKIIILLLTVAVGFLLFTTTRKCTNIGSLLMCHFRYEGIEDVKLSGINISKVKRASDLGFTDLAFITSSYLSGKMPLEFIVKIEVENPNEDEAVVDRIDWFLEMNSVVMARGFTEDALEVPGNNGKQFVPLKVVTNLMEVFSGESREALINLAFSIVGADRDPTILTFKLKPTVTINGKEISSKEYFEISNSFMYE